jgi:uncharacterized membrane protein YkoI
MKRILLLFGWMPLALGLIGSARGAEDLEHENEGKLHENARKHFSKAKLTLEQAIELALKKYPDGRAIEAGFDVEEDDYDFYVEVASGGRHHEVEIDAITGKIEDDKEEAEAESKKEDNENAAAKSKFTLIQAIKAAQAAVPGKAFEVESQLKDGQLAFVVGVLSGEDIHDVWIDAATGKVLAKKDVK